MNLLEDISGGWYANNKLPKRKKIDNISIIEKGFEVRSAHSKRLWDDTMFQMNWVNFECVVLVRCYRKSPYCNYPYELLK